MITEQAFTVLALSFPGTETQPHFNRMGFKITGRRMFATYLKEDNTATIFLTPAAQSVFCKIDTTHIHPVPNKWGAKGATTFELNGVAPELVTEALFAAYNEILKKKK